MGRQRQRQRQKNRRDTQRKPTKQTQRQQTGIGRWPVILGAAIILVVIAGLVYTATRPSTAASPTITPGPTATPRSLAPSVDGVQCQAMENVYYHIHQYLYLYDHGRRVNVPSDVGIPGGEYYARCYYWIHVHLGDPNRIHVESPTATTYRLGTFFDIWKATKKTTTPPGDAYVRKLEAAAARGQVTVFYNGKPWHKSYRDIPLTAHAVITIEIGKPVVPPKPFTAWNGE